MGRVYEQIDSQLSDWVARQPLFFVGSAPISTNGHVNISPKGAAGSLAVLGPHSVAYLDLTGSGAETIAHVRENQRIVIMLCAFEGRPRIVRLHGRGHVLAPGDPRFEELIDCFQQPEHPLTRRAIVEVDVRRIADSCGYGVPLMSYQQQRPHMELWAAKKFQTGGPNAILDYQREKNATSIDGLPAIQTS